MVAEVDGTASEESQKVPVRLCFHIYRIPTSCKDGESIYIMVSVLSWDPNPIGENIATLKR